MPRVAKKSAEQKAQSKAVIDALPDASWVPPKPEVPKAPEQEPVKDDRPCLLELVVAGSKLVMVRDSEGLKAVLTTPSGEVPLKPDDMARALPEGAKIRKLGDRMYVATQLNPVIGRPDLTTSTAREAITRFIPHFHGTP